MRKETILKYLAYRIDQVICGHNYLNIIVFTDDGEEKVVSMCRNSGESDADLIERGFEQVEKEYPIDEVV